MGIRKIAHSQISDYGYPFPNGLSLSMLQVQSSYMFLGYLS